MIGHVPLQLEVITWGEQLLGIAEMIELAAPDRGAGEKEAASVEGTYDVCGRRQPRRGCQG